MDPVLRSTSTWEPSFEEIFDLSLDLLCIGGLDGYFKRVNPAFEQAFGYSSQELLSRPFLELVHPEDRARSSDALDELTRGREVIRFENRNVCADGSTLWLEWSARPVPGERIFYGAARDVTDRKDAEHVLRQAQEVVEVSRDELHQLADEQAALRRVATMVARGVSSTEVLDAVAEEVGRLFDADWPAVSRYEPDGTLIILSARGTNLDNPVGTRAPLDGESVAGSVKRTGRPARMESYVGATGSLAARARELGIRFSVGAPIIVEGRLWGVMTAAWTCEEPPPEDTEGRMANFTELVATAIANAESQAELRVHVDEQAALRRVATLVARGVSRTEVLDAVAEEVGRLLTADLALLLRYESDGVATVLASWGAAALHSPVGTCIPLRDESITALVLRTGRPARMPTGAERPGAGPAPGRELGVRSGIGAPITVEGRLWGVMLAAWTRQEPVPSDDVEGRMANFAELVGTAIANAESQAELTASRARVIAATAEERQRVVRDLHDGAQQRLVQAVINLKLAFRELERGDQHAQEFVGEALDHAERANSELRELAHGILPGVLTSGGLRPGVEALASRSSLPVIMDVSAERLPPAIEATAYFVVSEALTNVVKHSGADGADVRAQLDNGLLRVEIRDDGIGGADPGRGSGLTGLRDRVEALGGTIEIASPAGSGTSVLVRIPI
jgi:PAS domain S-box-containing protein